MLGLTRLAKLAKSTERGEAGNPSQAVWIDRDLDGLGREISPSVPVREQPELLVTAAHEWVRGDQMPVKATEHRKIQ